MQLWPILKIDHFKKLLCGCHGSKLFYKTNQTGFDLLPMTTGIRHNTYGWG